MVFSPNFIYTVEPLLNVYFNSIGVSDGSKSSKTFSNSTGLPN
jgi:hypothetical protein